MTEDVEVCLIDKSEQRGEDASVLIIQLIDEKNFYKLYDIEIEMHPTLAVIPPRWIFWRALRSRYSWKVVVAFYLIFVLALSTVGAIMGAAQNNGPSVYLLSGTGCGSSGYNYTTSKSFNEYYVNGTFEYFIQGRIGVCIDKSPQQLGSDSCILWTDDTFWESFEKTIKNDDYSNSGCMNCYGNAAQNAKENVVYPQMITVLNAMGAIATLMRPAESLFSYFTGKRRVPVLSSNFGYFIRAVIIFLFNFANLLNTLIIGMNAG